MREEKSFERDLNICDEIRNTSAGVCSVDLHNVGGDDQINSHDKPYKVSLSDVPKPGYYYSVLQQEIVKSHPVSVRM